MSAALTPPAPPQKPELLERAEVKKFLKTHRDEPLFRNDPDLAIAASLASVTPEQAAG